MHYSLDRTLRRADAFAAFGERGFVLANDIDARRLLFTANNLNLVNRGMTGLDVAFRVGTVFETYKEGGNWQKEAGVQTGGFLTSSLGVKAGQLVTRGALSSINVGKLTADLTLVGTDLVEGVTLAALGPEIIVVMAGTLAGFAAETAFEAVVN